MSKDPIEELFRDNQHGLDEQPRGLIWDRIDEKLDEKSIISKRNNWWKLSVAACVVAGFSFAAYFFLFDSNPVPEKNQEMQIVYEPAEINEENASEMLDKLEEQKQSVVTTHKNKRTMEIMEDKAISEMEAVSPPELYDFAPASAPVYEAVPQMSRSEEKLEIKDAEEAIVFRGDTPEKKGKNYITQKEIDERRMGNMAEVSISYDSVLLQNQLQVQTKKHLINYELTSRSGEQLIFSNNSIPYPNQIIFQKSNDSIQVIYKGKDSKRNSKESKEIQKYIEDNKKNIITNFGWD